MLKVAKTIVDSGFVSLKNAFIFAFPNVTYNTTYAFANATCVSEN